jgi:hypothetical protein
MRDLSVRASDSEWMDGDEVGADVFAACVASLATVNTLTLARPPTLAWLGRATARLDPAAPFTVIDVGFGDGDMLRAVRRWADRRGLDPELIGYDLNPRSAPAASGRTDPGLRIAFRTGDAFAGAEPVDFVISSLTAHHMTDDELVAFLRWMEASASRGWFINDLHRHPLAYHGFKLLAGLARFHPFVRHDGPISVARSFRRADWLRLLARAGIDARVVDIVWRFPFRLCVERLK